MRQKWTVTVVLTAFLTVVTVGFSTPSLAGEHPRLKKLGMILGVGALTGGLGAVVLGGGVVHGAAMGAGTHLGTHKLREKWDEHKARHGE